jgi:hypothetical protein
MHASSSLSAYAKHRGCSKQAVSRAIAAGRLIRSVTKVNGRPVVRDFAAADREWADNTDRSRLPIEVFERSERHERLQQLQRDQQPDESYGMWEVRNVCIAGEEPIEVTVLQDDEAVCLLVSPTGAPESECLSAVMPPRVARALAMKLLEHATRLDGDARNDVNE